MQTLQRRTHNFLAMLALITAYLLAPASAWAQRSETSDVAVFAAASLKTALDNVVADYQKSTGQKVVVSYAASSALAKQIEQAAPADLFISADLEWMEYLAQKNLINATTRKSLLGNALVLVAPAASKIDLKIEKGFALAAALGEGKLAMGEVKSVPAGKYGKAALETLGVWSSIEPKVAMAENVRAALALVAREEATLGIVYKTDAAAEPKVKIVGTFPEDSHPPIIYPLAVTAATKNESGSAAFAKYLSSPEAQARFMKEGFSILK